MALLPGIKGSEDIKKLALGELPVLAAEVRRLLVDGVSRTGGHLASSLGAADLILALHYEARRRGEKLMHRALARLGTVEGEPAAKEALAGIARFVYGREN